MVFKRALLGLAAAGTILGSTAVQAAPANIDAVRASSAQEAEALAGGFNYGWVLLGVIAASVAAIVVAESDDDDAPDVDPVSP